MHSIRTEIPSLSSFFLSTPMGNCFIMGDPKPNQVDQKHIGEVDMNGVKEEHTEKVVKSSVTSGSISPSRSPREFTLDQLRKATSNFALHNLVGAGGFGHVYKGGMEGCEIAVKVLNANGCQGHKEWLTEVEALGKLHHPNLVQLLGLCSDHDQRLLVYKYMPIGSLDNALSHKECSELTWERRLRIATGIAKGLAYLHNQQPPIIHRDLKPSNILIDSNYEAKLCDFGLARDGPTAAMSHVSTRVMGTHAYVDPEYFQTGKLRLGSDVYGFGVVLLQILTGRAPLVRTSSGQWRGIAEWARPWLGGSRRACRIRVIMDPRLRGYPPMPAFYAGVLAARCTSLDLQLRPTADRVVSELRAVACHMVSSRRLHNGD